MTRFVGIEECKHISGAAVVIDVLRAFTVAPIAISRGAREIVLVESLEEALQLKAATPSSLAFKDGPPQDGFDLLNSPAHLLKLDVGGRTIFQKTTAGTRAALAAKHCEPLLCTSFVCASATAKLLRELDQEPTYVISGDDGNAVEDLAAAHFIDALVADPKTDPAPFIQLANESNAAKELRKGVELGYVGVHPADIEICLDVDRLDFCLGASVGPHGVTLLPLGPLAAI